MKNKKLLLALGVLILVVAVMAGLFLATRPRPQEGAKSVTVTVVHKDKTERTETYHTDEEYLGPLMVAKGLIPEGNIQSGMFDTVDGEKAVWTEDEGWWGVYKGEELLTLGVNEQVIADGDAFRFVYINGFAS